MKMKSEYKDILNALVEMQESPVYATRKTTLFYAEQAIFSLEQKVKLLERQEYICKKCGLRKDGEHDHKIDF